MQAQDKDKLRVFLKSCLEENGNHEPLNDDDSLFMSARLDSLDLTNLVIFLEQTFGVNFAKVMFEVEMIDSINEIESFLDQQ